MRFFISFIWVLFICSPFAVVAQTEAVAPIVIIYESGGNTTDRAFIDMARNGADLAKRELNVHFAEHIITPQEQREEVFKRYASQGAKLIIALGFQNVSTVLAVAEQHPGTYFTVIDGMIPPLFNNVQSIVFRDNEGAFLVGMIAALHSKNKVIGFIGGMDVPVIRDFGYGFRQGAQYIEPKITVLREMLGTTKEAWSSPELAADIAQKQIAQGADVIFAAAGGSSLGMLKKVSEYDNVFSIGVDTNQNAVYPGSVLTSLVKRVDKAVFDAISQQQHNTWQPGIKYMGIKEGALDYSVDKYNRDKLSKTTIDKVERTKDFIIRGLVKVDNYRPK
jgi:basic membrane protein A